MKAKPKSKSPKRASRTGEARSQQRVGMPPGGAEKDAIKEAWMAGAASGTEVAWELMMVALENMARTLGIKKRKRPSGEVCESLPRQQTPESKTNENRGSDSQH